MRILALDPGTTTGYALNTTPIIFGHWDLKPHRYESGGMRYIRFKLHLAEIYGTYKPNLIAFEEIQFHRTSLAAQVYGALVSHLMVFCEEKKIEYCGVVPGTWKKFVTGKGNANKIKTIRAVIEKYKLQPQDDNEADAIGILKWAEKEYGGKSQ